MTYWISFANWTRPSRNAFFSPRRTLFTACSVGLIALACTAQAQSVRVAVDLNQNINVFSPISLGMPAAMFDAASFNPAAAPYLRLAGATTIRYPGNAGTADLYHWSTNTVTKYRASEPPYVNPDANFGNFARNLDKFGTALLVVNYGTNLDGNGGADAGEAAAWVAYANGGPDDARPIPRDKDGDDWHTVGFWATIRSQNPLPTDDGFNFLRIGHPKPFGIFLWQIGDQVFNNGFYGGKQTGEPDLHAPAPSSARDLAKLEKNQNLSPTFYGARLNDFTRMMKSVDPTIRVGASLALVDGSPSDADWNTRIWALDWDSKVLKAACPAIDFVTIGWQAFSLLPPDWKTLNEADVLGQNRVKISKIVGGLLDMYKGSCPKDHLPRIAFAPAAIPTWPHIEHPVMEALWVADTYAVLTESGTQNTSWSEMTGDAVISADLKKFGPAYMGMEMLHLLARNPGDAFVRADSSSQTLKVHATRRRDGVIGLMLINDDPKNEISAAVTLSGVSAVQKARRFDYGQAQYSAGTSLVQSELTGVGDKFAVTVPAYTVTVVLLAPGN